MFKRFLAAMLCFLSCLLLFPSLSLSVAASPSLSLPAPSLSAESAVLIESANGSILCEKNAHKKMAMASTTKIMTALVATEAGNLDRTVSVSAEAVGVEGSSIYLFAGERMTLRDLIAAMLLESANDAAAAIAIEVGGSIDSFCDMMNEKAEKLGLKDTHFTNPHGLYDEEHYTTAYELAVIAREALKSELIRRIVSTKKMTVEPVLGSTRLLYNHNKLLSMYDGATGVKTGFTKKSGRCLVGSAKRDGLELITVTLNAPDDWNDHKKLFDFGFENFKSAILAKKGEVCYMQSVIGGVEERVALTCKEDVILTIRKGDEHNVEKIVETINRYEFAPISAQKTAGRLLFTIDGETVAEATLVTSTPIKQAPGPDGFFTKILNLFK